MKVFVGLAIVMLATQLGAQTASDETAIRSIVQDEIAAWNQGDAVAYSRHFPPTAHLPTSRASSSPDTTRFSSNTR